VHQDYAIEDRTDQEGGRDAQASSAPVAELVSRQRTAFQCHVEGFNNKAKLTTRKAFGFPTYHAIGIDLYHALGALPESKFTHRFC
jgi:hypothetical protein